MNLGIVNTGRSVRTWTGGRKGASTFMEYSVNEKGPLATNQAPRYLPVETAAVQLHVDSDRPTGSVFGVLANISDTGACVIANSNVPEGPVVVAISLGRRRASLQVPGRVVWCSERVEPIKEIAGYLTGVRFDEAADASIRELLDSESFEPTSEEDH